MRDMVNLRALWSRHFSRLLASLVDECTVLANAGRKDLAVHRFSAITWLAGAWGFLLTKVATQGRRYALRARSGSAAEV